MNKNTKSILAASLSIVVVSQCVTPVLALSNKDGKWMSGEYHTHTTQSNDAGEAINKVENSLDAAFTKIDPKSPIWKDGEKWELPVQNTDAEGAQYDYLVTADHLRPSLRDPEGNNYGDNSEKVPFYVSLQNQLKKVDELQSQGKYEDKIIHSGFEWDMLGLDHASVGIIANNDKNMIKGVKEFEYRYSKETTDKYFNDEEKEQYGPRKNQDIKENTIDGIKWLKENYPKSYVLINHPSRKNGSSSELKIEDIRKMNDIAPKIVFGFEGILGNQMSNDGRGESAEVYGGADGMLAQVGGMWDALLGEGRKFYTFANSDCHFKVRKDYSGGSYSGYWPAEYSRNYSWVEGNSINDVVDGLRSGKSFSVMGDLIDELDFSIEASGKKAEMGDEIRAKAGEEMTLTIRFKSPEINNYETIFGSETDTTNKVSVHHIDLISGEVTGKIAEGSKDYTNPTNESTKVVASFTSEDWTTDKDGYNVIKVNVPADTNRYYRLRGTNLGYNVEGQTDENGNPLRDEKIDKPTADQVNDSNYNDLWFYSNPIFVDVHKSNGNGNKFDKIVSLFGNYK